MQIVTRWATAEDQAWVDHVLSTVWHGPLIERTDEYIDASTLPAIVAIIDDERVGLAHVLVHPDHLEVFTLKSCREGIGVGAGLMCAAEEHARAKGLGEVRVFTANSNLRALRFYQKLGYRLWAIHRDTITRAREHMKPDIPMHEEGILIADEVELRKELGAVY